MRDRRRQAQPEGVSVEVQVNVTKIVRYLCVTGVLIVGIIFGTRCYRQIFFDSRD